MPPAPIWKIRNRPFLLVWARAPAERAATPRARTAPFFRKVRRVTGEECKRLAVVSMIVDTLPAGSGTQEKDDAGFWSRRINKLPFPSREMGRCAGPENHCHRPCANPAVHGACRNFRGGTVLRTLPSRLHSG